jgi:hypothetical protein
LRPLSRPILALWQTVFYRLQWDDSNANIGNDKSPEGTAGHQGVTYEFHITRFNAGG